MCTGPLAAVRRIKRPDRSGYLPSPPPAAAGRKIKKILMSQIRTFNGETIPTADNLLFLERHLPRVSNPPREQLVVKMTGRNIYQAYSRVL